MQTTTNYVFVALDTQAIVLRINDTINVVCANADEVIAAFEQYNIKDTDTIMCSSDMEFATEYDFASDSAAQEWLDAAFDTLNFRHPVIVQNKYAQLGTIAQQLAALHAKADWISEDYNLLDALTVKLQKMCETE
jgi:hypothetical protein